MADVLAWTSNTLTVATLVIALLLVVFARRSVAAVALAVFLAGWGGAGLSGPIVRGLGGGIALTMKWVWISQLVSSAGILAFAVVYPNIHITRTRWALLSTIAGATLASAALMHASPDVLWYDSATGARRMTPIVGTTLGVFGGGLPVLILGIRWLTASPGTYRTQVAWGILPPAWWVLHDGLGYMVYRWALGWSAPPDPTSGIMGALAWLNVAAIAFTLALMGVAWTRTLRGQGSKDDRAIGFVLLYMLPVTLVQLVLPYSTAPGVPPVSHLLLDYAVVPLAVYGVLRHRVVDIDLKLKIGVRHSTVAAAFVGMFFVAATVAQEFLADSLGWLVGGIAAGMLVFVMAPIQRVAERVSSTALPHARADPGYLTYRRFQIYRVALEGTLRDGVIEPSETSTLRGLRTELGLTLDDHRQLESEARARLVATPA